MHAPLTVITDDPVSQDVTNDGFGALHTQAGLLPLAAMDVRARLTGLYAEVSVRQTFVNVHAMPLEATYIFPLPDRAAVTRFQLVVAGRTVEGKLMERGAARDTYDQALTRGHRAAIAEEDRPGVFTMRVGNLPPGETASVHLELTGPLPFQDGEATFRFPLVVAPRFIPGAPLPGRWAGDGTSPDTDAVPDASRITPPVLLPGFRSPVRLGLSVEIDPAGLPLTGIGSSLHLVSEDSDFGSAVRRLRLNAGERLDRDFILRLRMAPDSAEGSAVFAAQPGSDTGALAVTLVPPIRAASTPRRDVVFVLDRSGSMAGWKIVAARRAICRMIDTLDARDRFDVLAFSDRVTLCSGQPQSGLVSATDRHRFAALESVAALEASGGTEMSNALSVALSDLAERAPGVERTLVLVTDGQVGNEDWLLRLVRDKARGVRIFTVGIDQAVNAAFLRRLADPSGGVCELIESEDRLDEAMRNLHRRIGTPVLTDVELEPEGTRLLPGSLTPAGSRDVFEGVPLVLLCRVTGAPPQTIGLRARMADGTTFRLKVPVVAATTPVVGRAWARAHIRDLEDRYVSEGLGDSALADRIVRTSLEFGVLSRFTAFVAVDEREIVNPGGLSHHVVQPVEQPQGWAMSAQVAGVGGFASRSVAAPSPKRAQSMDDIDFCLMDSADMASESGSGELGSYISKESGPEVPASGSGGGGGLFDAVSDFLGKLPSMPRSSGRGRSPRVKRTPSPSNRALTAELASLLRALAEALERLETLADETDVRAELAYLIGDLELALEAIEQTPGLSPFALALRPLLEGLRNLRRWTATDRPSLASLLAALREALDAVKSGSPAPPAPARREFWK
ncbi:MAG: VWA domain-containing protein [Candidatus Wallbacteria bacterium]|nr:VWA domain-containing protein [Candidatus Wallbacteria bacterium]